MKKKLIIILTITASLLLVLCGCNAGNTYAHAASYTAGNGEADNITNLDIEWISGAVNVHYGEGTKLLFSETAERETTEEETMHWWIDGATLRIKFAKSGYRAQHTPQKTLSVTLPQNLTLNELEIESVSADVTIGGIIATKVDVECVSGNITATGVTATNSAEFETVSGNVTLLNVNAAKELDLQSVSGGIRATLEHLPSELDLETVSGNAVLILGETASFSAAFETTSGKFECAFGTPLKSGKKYTVTAGAATCKIDAESVSGDLIIQKTEE